MVVLNGRLNHDGYCVRINQAHTNGKGHVWVKRIEADRFQKKGKREQIQHIQTLAETQSSIVVCYYQVNNTPKKMGDVQFRIGSKSVKIMGGRL